MSKLFSLVLFMLGCGGAQNLPQDLPTEYLPPTSDISMAVIGIVQNDPYDYNDAIESGYYDEVSEEIYFYRPGELGAGGMCPSPSAELLLVHFDAGNLKAEQVEEMFARHGLRSANACELVLLGTLEDYQTSMNIVALGARTRTAGGVMYYMHIMGDSEGRRLVLLFNYGWGDRTWFLAARLSDSARSSQ